MKARKEERCQEGGKRRKNLSSSKFEKELKKLECYVNYKGAEGRWLRIRKGGRRSGSRQGGGKLMQWVDEANIFLIEMLEGLLSVTRERLSRDWLVRNHIWYACKQVDGGHSILSRFLGPWFCFRWWVVVALLLSCVVRCYFYTPCVPWCDFFKRCKYNFSSCP